MKIVYIGPFSDGELFDGERAYPFRRGIAIAVSDAYAKRVLAEQDNESPNWVDEGNPKADEAAEAAATIIADAEYDKESGKN
jgi:hypothetical protein